MIRFNIFGHPNILCNHKNTLEFTKQDFVTKKGDCILKTMDGMKILVIQSHLATKLEGLLLDYEEIIEDFIISEMTRH